MTAGGAVRLRARRGRLCDGLQDAAPRLRRQPLRQARRRHVRLHLHVSGQAQQSVILKCRLHYLRNLMTPFPLVCKSSIVSKINVFVDLLSLPGKDVRQSIIPHVFRI